MGRINPTFIDNMGRHMGDVYGAVTDQILINLARYFPYYKPGQPVPQSSFEYQSVMLAQMGQVTQETINIVRGGLSGANSALQDVLQQAIMESVKKAQPDLLDAVNRGLLFPEKRPIISPEQMKAYWSYYLQASDKLNLVNTVMLESTRQAYQSTVSDIVNRIRATQNALDIGAGETITGVSSWNQAVKHAIDRMTENGITGFIDHAGRRWNAESYVSMDIRTTLANTARAAVWETNQNFGNDLYQVSYHNGARPLCYPWQNKVISSTNNARVVKDLDGNEIPVYNQSDTSYGAPAGLFGINCKHYPTPFIPGVSVTRGEPQSEEENSRTYAESQQQRALERKIREEKRDLLMLKAQNAPEELIREQRARIRQTDDEIDKFCEETGRTRRQNREGVYTKRSFPDPKTYDAALFERDQKEIIDRYFTSGGSQQNYTFGTMKPNEEIGTERRRRRGELLTAEEEKAKWAKIEAEKAAKANNPLIVDVLPKYGISPLEVKKLDTPRTIDDIISVLGGGDKTKGSCSSLAYAYAGQRAGYDVIDFRGGKSQDFFSCKWLKIAKFDGVDGQIVDAYNDFVGSHVLLRQVEVGKEYYFSTGRHAAIIRKTADDSLEYLELQSRYENGWFKLDDRALKDRFAAKKQHTYYGEKYECSSVLVDIEKFGKSPDFVEMLKYINTEASKQKKGVAGGIR